MSRATRRSPTGRSRATTRRRVVSELDAKPKAAEFGPLLLFTILALLLMLVLGFLSARSPGPIKAEDAPAAQPIKLRQQVTETKPIEDFEDSYESGFSED